MSSSLSPEQQTNNGVLYQDRPHRSVNDFNSAEDLERALKDMSITRSSSDGQYISFAQPELHQPEIERRQQLGTMSEEDATSITSLDSKQHEALDPELDWVLENYDRETTEAQSLNEELQRLLVLKSYLMLDDERKRSFERITGLASRILKCPIALISLIDLGRQWFMSNRGLGDARETDRKYAFCAHAIMSTENFFIVNDATKDKRFMNNPLVTGPPYVTFYCGVPLISPEGYKLGTLCVIDREPRHQGIGLEEKQNLMELAALAVEAVVDHRRQKMKEFNDPAQLIAFTAHDLLTPLNGMQLSLSLLMEDEVFKSKLTAQQREMITTASSCTGVMERICKSAIAAIRERPGDRSQSSGSKQISNGGPRGKDASQKQNQVVISDFVKSLYMVLEPFPKKVPLIILIDSSVPESIITDDLKVFRAAVNYLTNALWKTETGSVKLTISTTMKHGGQKLLFECEDTGPGIPVERISTLFRPVRENGDMIDKQYDNCLAPNPDGTIDPVSQVEEPNAGLGLYSVAVNISSIGGEYGYRPHAPKKDYTPAAGAVFWFTIPLILSREEASNKETSLDPRLMRSFTDLTENKLAPSCSVQILKTASISDIDAGRLYTTFTRVLEGGVEADQNSSVNVQGPTQENCSNKTSLPIDVEDQRSHNDSGAGTKIGEGTVSSVEEALLKEILLPPTAVGVPMKKAVTTVEGKRCRRALVIEDSLVVRKSLTRVLTKLGFETVQAVDGLEGLNELKASLFDVVLCDFLMPVMDGLDCVKQYREWEDIHRSFFRQYIVGISAHASENDIKKGLEVGMDDFKPKPVTYKQLGELDKSDALRIVGEKLEEIATAGTMMIDTSPQAANSGEVAVECSEDGKSPAYYCLIGTDKDNVDSSLVETIAEKRRWTIAKVHDGESVLRMLQVRNWDAVLLDENLPILSPTQCVGRFREWESLNRVNRQHNVVLWSASCSPALNGISHIIQLPHGFDSSLGKPTRQVDIELIMARAEQNGKNFRLNDIVAR